VKPQPIIARFISCKKRPSEFLYAKAKLKDSEDNEQAYITEDLTA